jgi:hypothetical protein
MLNDRDSLNDLHDSHLSQASVSAERLKQFNVLAKMRAQVVFPTPLGPQNKYACAVWPVLMAFFSVLVTEGCPTTVSKLTGRYFLADTMKLLMLGFHIPAKISIYNFWIWNVDK